MIVFRRASNNIYSLHGAGYALKSW